MDRGVFNEYSHYYDHLYHEKNYTMEVDYVQSLLINHGISKGELLEFGSGTGKHGRLLAEKGYRVHGIERSNEMISRSIPAEGFTCQQGDIRNIRLGRKFNAVLALFHVISYQTDNQSIEDFFNRAADHLSSPGGFFIFDMWYSPAVYAQRPEVRVRRIVNSQVSITRLAEPIVYPNENRVDVCYTIFIHDILNNSVKVVKEVHPMRHFSIPEIDLWAKISGFKIVGVEEFITAKKPSIDTWGVCVILSRI